MARLARVVIPGVAHHVTQRGNRRQPIFFSDDDRRTYLALLHQGCEKAGVRCLAWCLMDNHVHLILVPEHADGLRATLGEAHRRYTSHVNARQGWSGYLFQGRFASYPMDDAHLMAAVRYVELNPVVAGIVPHAEDWPWSSARSHIAGKRVAGDPLTDVATLGDHVANWRAMLRHGAEASDLDETFEARLRTGRPLGDTAWIGRAEASLARPLGPSKRGPKFKTPPSN
jgi:putative transposase